MYCLCTLSITIYIDKIKLCSFCFTWFNCNSSGPAIQFLRVTTWRQCDYSRIHQYCLWWRDPLIFSQLLNLFFSNFERQRWSDFWQHRMSIIDRSIFVFAHSSGRHFFNRYGGRPVSKISPKLGASEHCVVDKESTQEILTHVLALIAS